MGLIVPFPVMSLNTQLFAWMKQEKFKPEIYPQLIYFTLAICLNEWHLTQCLCDPEREKIKQLQWISNSSLSLCFGKQSMSTYLFSEHFASV